MAQQKLEAARKDVAALQAAAGQSRAGDNSSEQAAAAEAVLADRQRKLAGLEQRILELEDRIYAPLSDAVRNQGIYSLHLSRPRMGHAIILCRAAHPGPGRPHICSPERSGG